MIGPLRVSSPEVEGILSVSKSLKFPVLLDAVEMEELFHELGGVTIYCVSEVVSQEKEVVSHTEFLAAYTIYVEALKRGEIPPIAKRCFSAALTIDPTSLYAMQVGANRFLVKPLNPLIQMQHHAFFHSSVDGKFHSMVAGPESVMWGIQFSYPQLFKDPKTHQIAKVGVASQFPNTEYFLRLVKWMRKQTVATPFLVQGKRVNVPIRIGKKCFPWIGSHPQLAPRGLRVLNLFEGAHAD
jgi:hypothetical protein